MKTKEIITTGLIGIFGTVLGIILTFSLAIKRDSNEKQKDYINLLNTAKTEIEFYLPVYHESLSSTNKALKGNVSGNIDAFAHFTSPSLLNQCKIELLKHSANHIVIRHISGCHYDLEKFYANCQYNWDIFKQNKNAIQFKLIEPNLIAHKEVVEGIIANAISTITLLQNEIDNSK